jgi:CMP-N-acetylneuraminic acid synthetase
MLEMRKTESIDIDDQESWDMAEAMAIFAGSNNNSPGIQVLK